MSAEPSSSPEPRRSDTPQPRLSTGTVLLAMALAAFAYLLSPVLLWIFAGITLAVALDGLAVAIARRTPMSRGIALLAVSLTSAALLSVFFAATAPQILAQFEELQKTLAALADDVSDWLGDAELPTTMEDFDELPEELAEAVGPMLQHLAQWGMTTLGVVASIGVALVITGFAAADPALYRGGFVALLPHAKRPMAEEALSAVAHALRWWFLSQLISMLLLGATVAFGLWLIGIELWLALGVLTALLTFVPYLGPLLAGIPVVMVAFAEGLETALVVTVAYLVVQNVEGNVLMPWIQHKVVRLAPVLAISAQMLLGLLLGPAGFILAAPITVTGMVLVQKLWVEQIAREHA